MDLDRRLLDSCVEPLYSLQLSAMLPSTPHHMLDTAQKPKPQITVLPCRFSGPDRHNGSSSPAGMVPQPPPHVVAEALRKWGNGEAGRWGVECGVHLFMAGRSLIPSPMIRWTVIIKWRTDWLLARRSKLAVSEHKRGRGGNTVRRIAELG